MRESRVPDRSIVAVAALLLLGRSAPRYLDGRDRFGHWERVRLI